jgi:hypothetical protein
MGSGDRGGGSAEGGDRLLDALQHRTVRAINGRGGGRGPHQLLRAEAGGEAEQPVGRIAERLPFPRDLHRLEMGAGAVHQRAAQFGDQGRLVADGRAERCIKGKVFVPHAGENSG